MIGEEMRRHSLVILAIVLSAISSLQAQTPEGRTGPVILHYGAVYAFESTAVPTPEDREYHAVFEVALAPENPGEVNRRIETLARFLNMHAQAGVPSENVRAALVIHGPAGRSLLRDDEYRTKYGTGNPDRALISALAAAGVDIVMCGQTAMARGFYPELLVPEAKVALSAMTALVMYQMDGYASIAF